MPKRGTPELQVAFEELRGQTGEGLLVGQVTIDRPDDPDGERHIWEYDKEHDFKHGSIPFQGWEQGRVEAQTEAQHTGFQSLR